jgi:hypothetical protein
MLSNGRRRIKQKIARPEMIFENSCYSGGILFAGANRREAFRRICEERASGAIRRHHRGAPNPCPARARALAAVLWLASTARFLLREEE